MRFLLDTNVVSEPLRPRPNAGLLARVERHRTELAIGAPVWHELVFGLSRLAPSKKRDVVRRYVYEVVQPTLEVLPYDGAAAEWHAHERARLERAGRPTAFVDGQIAAIARVHGLTLVTRNVGHFAPFEGLRLESWFD